MTQVAPPPRRSRAPQAHAPASRKPAHRRRPGRRGAVAIAAASVAIVATVAVLAVVGRNTSTGSAATGATSTAATVLQRTARVDAAVIEKVGTAGLPVRIYALKDAPALSDGGRPEILYVGADFCPYCAAQRWSMVVALSRFGTFASIGLTTSSDSDVYPGTATFSFSGMQYSSRYLSFVAVETADRAGTPKEALSAAQKQLLSTYDAPPYVPANAAGGIPWVDFAGGYAMASSGFTPQILAGLDWNQISEKLGDAGDLVTQGIVGNANILTAGICKVTGMQPADVCTAAPVAQIVPTLP